MADYFEKIVIYVDGANGSDSQSGAIDAPYQTLNTALQDIKTGGLIVLQEGTYTLGGYGVIEKNVSIQAAYGADATIADTLQFSNFQGRLEGLNFSTGIVKIDNSGYGGVIVRNCVFNGITNPLIINYANYVALHENTFANYDEAIRVSVCNELVISANIFYSDTASNGRAIYISDVEWLDVYHNTIYGANSTGGSSVSDENLRIIYVSMNSGIISRKSVSLPTFAVSNDYGYDVAVNVVNGSTLDYGKDYTVINSGITVSWDGLDLENQLNAYDVLRIMYSEASSAPTSGEAISAYNVYNENSRVDSNNINNSSIGIVFTDDVKIRYNNFNGTSSFYSGTTTDEIGNITGAPQYLDASGADFRLQASSPNINNADLDRWDTILQEMGIGKISGHYTGISLPTGRAGIAPFNRNLDRIELHRLSRSDRDDIGAYEYPSTGTNPETYAYISEDGFDLINSGSITGPFATIDRGFSGAKDIQVKTNSLGRVIINPDGTLGITGIDAGATGYHYSRYGSKDINLESLEVKIGQQNKNSIAFFHPSFPSNTATGTYVGILSGNESGETGSKNNPYRTIDQAILYNPTATTIYVKPGIYPSFEGVSGKKLIGIPELKTLSFNGNRYFNFDTTGWTGSSELVLNRSNLYFDVSTGLTGSALSNFKLSGRVYFKIDWIIIADTMEIRLYNSSNYVSVKKQNNRLYFQHHTGGSTYTSQVISMDTSYRVSFQIIDSRAITKVKGSLTNIDRSISLSSGYSEPWAVKINYKDEAAFSVTGSATGVIYDLHAKADSFTGVQGVTGSAMYRKVFGVAGEKGLSGLYALYGI